MVQLGLSPLVRSLAGRHPLGDGGEEGWEDSADSDAVRQALPMISKRMSDACRRRSSRGGARTGAEVRECARRPLGAERPRSKQSHVPLQQHNMI